MALIPKGGNDCIYTPEYLAKDIIDYFSKYFSKDDSFLEPAKGNGSFYNYLPKNKDYCEIQENKDFFNYTKTN